MKSKKIAVVLATRDGELFLEEQLESIKNQTYQNFDLYISDDSSIDRTKAIIKKFIDDNPSINIIFYEKIYRSFQRNFLETLANITDDYAYYCFCDQDDIWEETKLEHARSLLNNVTENMPNLFCSSTKVINHENQEISASKQFYKRPSLQNALVQSIAGGNTMVFNLHTKLLLNRICNYENIVSHDWITYLLVACYEGRIIYSPHPLIKYRVHKKNTIGPNTSIIQRLERFNALLKGKFSSWTDKNLDILLSPKFEDMPERSIRIIMKFKEIKHEKLMTRFYSFMNLRLYRQTIFSSIAIFIFAMLKKL